jgi:imidazolonepropionase-like amidohydrolase
MPGLIDAHFHAYAVEVDFLKLESYSATYLSQRGRHPLTHSLRRGFTTVRDVGGADYGPWRGEVGQLLTDKSGDVETWLV